MLVWKNKISALLTINYAQQRIPSNFVDNCLRLYCFLPSLPLLFISTLQCCVTWCICYHACQKMCNQCMIDLGAVDIHF